MCHRHELLDLIDILWVYGQANGSFLVKLAQLEAQPLAQTLT
jgi:hypothetical protein